MNHRKSVNHFVVQFWHWSGYLVEWWGRYLSSMDWGNNCLMKSTHSRIYNCFEFSFPSFQPAAIPIKLKESSLPITDERIVGFIPFLGKHKQSLPISVLDMALNHLMLRIQSWSFGECGALLHCHYSQVYPAVTCLDLIYGVIRNR